MKRTDFRRIVGSGILALALLATGAVTPSPAQPPADTGPQGRTTTDDTTDDGGMDLGWLGLLGLAGLLGLRRRDDHHVTRVDTTTGTGSPRTRV